MRNQNLLTKGKVSKALLTFALPFMFANILQALYGAVDLFVVGRFDTSFSVSAVAIGSQVMTIITGFILGLSMGGTILLGRCIGKEDDEGSANAIGTMTILFVILAVIITPIITLNIDTIIPLLQTPREAMEATKQYLFICAIGIPCIVGYNVVSSIYRGLGDSKTPMYLIGVACVVNVIVDFILVGGYHMGAAGAAIATVLAQAVSFLLAVINIKRKGFSFALTKRHFKISKDSVLPIIKVGVPLAMQDALVSVSFLTITVIINGMGVIASASVGVVEKIIILAMLVPSAFGSSVATMVSQNLGANKPKRAIKSMHLGMYYSLAFGLFVFVGSQFFATSLTSIFSQDTSVIAMAATYLKTYSLDCVLVSIVFCYNAYFNGSGKSIVSFIHSMLATFAVRIPLSYIFSQTATDSLSIVGLAAPLASTLSVIICVSYFYYDRKRKQQQVLQTKTT